MGVLSYDVEARGVDCFPTITGVLTFELLETAVVGVEQLKGAVLPLSEEEGEPLGFLSNR